MIRRLRFVWREALVCRTQFSTPSSRRRPETSFSSQIAITGNEANAAANATVQVVSQSAATYLLDRLHRGLFRVRYGARNHITLKKLGPGFRRGDGFRVRDFTRLSRLPRGSTPHPSFPRKRESSFSYGEKLDPGFRRDDGLGV